MAHTSNDFMTFKTYLRNRALFESRYNPDEFNGGYSGIDRMMKGIRNRELFFGMYGYDRTIFLTQLVSSIDKAKRYIWKDKIGSRIQIRDLNHSMFERYPDQFKLTLDYLQKK